MAEPSAYQEHPNVPLLEAKKWLTQEAKTSGGAICPCCLTLSKARGKKPTAAQIAFLVVLYNNFKVGDIVDLEAAATAINMEGITAKGMERLTYWDLLELTETKNHIRLCEDGYYVVHSGWPIIPRAWILNDRVIARDGKPTKLVKILADKYDLNTMLSIRIQ